MPQHFDPALVNGPFGDPALYVDLVFERRALLFDLGDLSPLAARKLLRISDVFVTHRHMDHFAGFDHLLRYLIGREKAVRIYGSPGLIDAVEHKLRAYTWNLVEGYEGNLVFDAKEIDSDGRLTSAQFSGRNQFARAAKESRKCKAGLLLEEPAQINIWRNKVEAMGLAIGPWLRFFKEAVLRGAPDSSPIGVAWRTPAADKPSALPLGLLKKEIMKATSGRKIAYAVDCS